MADHELLAAAERGDVTRVTFALARGARMENRDIVRAGLRCRLVY